MALIADGLLIATCLTAALYCYVLSRRLRNLTNTEDGIGKQILQMNAALEETRAALKDLRGTSKSASERLAREVQTAKRCASTLETLIASSDQLTTRTYSQATPAPVEDVVNTDSSPSSGDKVDPEFDDEDLEDVAGFVGEEQLGFAPDAIESLPGGTATPEVAAVQSAPAEEVPRPVADEATLEAPPITPDVPIANDPAPTDETLIKVERMAL